MTERIVRLSSGLLFLAVLSGCGPGTGELKGTVKYKGKDLVFGTVTVYDTADRAFQGAVTQGRYSVPGITAGPVVVIVTSPNPAGKGPPGGVKDRDAGPRDGRPARDGGKAKVEGWFQIPERYGDKKSSPLKATVDVGSTDYNIDLID